MDAKHTGDEGSIDELKRLCEIISVEALTAAELARRLGTIVHDHGDSLPIDFRPAHPGFTQGQVVRRFGTEEASSVVLAVAGSAGLSETALRAAFGVPASAPRVHFDSPATLRFQVTPAGRTHGCVILAELREGSGGGEDGVVVRVTLQRQVILR